MADVVSNTSPPSYLHRLGRLALLHDLFGRIIVPDAVEWELARGRALGHDLPDPRAVPWMDVRASLPAAFDGLGPGETAALSIARTLPDSVVLLDDLPARVVAAELGLKFIGTVGVLVRAKTEGLIPAIAPELTRLLALRFRLSPAIQAEALAMCGET